MPLTRDPYEFDYTQEAFITEMFGHYRNQVPPVSLLWMPQWLKEGFSLLSHCVNIDREREKMKNAVR